MRSSRNISRPSPLKSWVERQVVARGYSTPSEYVRDLLRREQVANARSRVDDRLIESMESGPAQPMTRKDWERVRADGVKLARKRKTK